MECHSYCCADKIDLAKAELFFRQILGARVIKHWNAIEVMEEQGHQILYLFQNGTLVSWGIKQYKIIETIHNIEHTFVDKIPAYIHESFHYQMGPKSKMEPHPYFNVDCIILESEEKDIKLSISYALSQSIKCQYYEATLEVLIRKYSPIVTELSQTGWFKVSRNKIRKIIGEILFAKSQLNLTYNFLYRPKFFWRHPNLENEYNLVENYMEVPVRAEIIDHRLNGLNEIAMLCSNFLETKQSHFLEIVIIILIAMEIVIGIFNLHF